MLLVVSLMCLARTGWDRVSYMRNGQIRQKTAMVIREAEEATNAVQEMQNKSGEYDAKIKKEFERFKYREMISLLNEIVLSTLPNAQNTPDQKELYEAFANGDVEEVAKTPRKERKQLIVTNMSIYYSDNLSTAQFGSTATARRGELSTMEEEMASDDGELEAMRREYEALGYQMDPSLMAQLGMGEQAQVKDAGFVVTVAGYSPYKNVGELLDPIGVDDKPQKWGVATRLMHLDKIVDGNCPFELYNKKDILHFRLEKGPVDLKVAMPAGIGVLETMNKDGTTTTPVSARGVEAGWMPDPGGVRVLVDPLTREIISTVSEVDVFGKERFNNRGEALTKTNDNWFVLNFKLKWKDAPKDAGQTSGSAPVASAGVGGAAAAASSETVAPQSRPRQETRRRKGADFIGE
jgi:hypothetical protein